MAKQPSPKTEVADRHFRVAHTQVGGWPLGRVVSESEIKQHDGADLSRLLRLGAVVETHKHLSTEPLPAGPYNGGADNGSESPPIISAESDPDDVRSPAAITEDVVPKAKPEATEEEEEEQDEEEEDMDEDEDDGRVLPPPPPSKRAK